MHENGKTKLICNRFCFSRILEDRSLNPHESKVPSHVHMRQRTQQCRCKPVCHCNRAKLPVISSPEGHSAESSPTHCCFRITLGSAIPPILYTALHWTPLRWPLFMPQYIQLQAEQPLI